MKLKDFDETIEVFDATSMELVERLEELDPGSEEYERVAKSLKLIEETKAIEVQNRNSTKESRIPEWATSLFASIGALGLGLVLYRGEKNGLVVGSTGVSMLNKLRFGK